MAKLPEVGIPYYTYQFSAGDQQALNDPAIIHDFFSSLHKDTEQTSLYPFDKHGITAISISAKGYVNTIHTWPHPEEKGFAILTEMGGSIFRQNTATMIACEERDMGWLPDMVMQTYHPRRLYTAAQTFGVHTLNEGKIATATADPHSQVFWRKFVI